MTSFPLKSLNTQKNTYKYAIQPTHREIKLYIKANKFHLGKILFCLGKILFLYRIKFVSLQHQIISVTILCNDERREYEENYNSFNSAIHNSGFFIFYEL